MSTPTITRQQPPEITANGRAGQAEAAPPLNAGDVLTRIEFERRYHLYPEIKKAELIEGVVYMPSPARLRQHAQPHARVVTWLGVYSAATPGVLGADNATVRLDDENEVQPDAFLILPTHRGGRTVISEDDYLEGPPELIVQVAASSAAYDLHVKRGVYARNGVQEYVAIQVYEKRVDWFVLHGGAMKQCRQTKTGSFAARFSLACG